MRYANKSEPRTTTVKPEPTVPQECGFFWGKWRIPEDGTEDEDGFVFVDRWEVFEVFDAMGEADQDYRAYVPGVARTQHLENFVWAKPIRPIPPPAG